MPQILHSLLLILRSRKVNISFGNKIQESSNVIDIMSIKKFRQFLSGPKSVHGQIKPSIIYGSLLPGSGKHSGLRNCQWFCQLCFQFKHFFHWPIKKFQHGPYYPHHLLSIEAQQLPTTGRLLVNNWSASSASSTSSASSAYLTSSASSSSSSFGVHWGPTVTNYWSTGRR